jgi:transposase
MPPPLDLASLPHDAPALRSLLLQREADHAADLAAARAGLQEQVLRNEQLKLRLARLLRERFGASSEKLRGAIEQLELVLGELEEQVAETTPPEAEPPAAASETKPSQRKPARRPLPETLPRDVVEHPAPCACPNCGGHLRPLGEDVTEVLDYVPGTFRVIRHVRPKLSCRSCACIAQAPAPSLPIYRGLAGPGLLAHILAGKYCDHLPLYRQAEIYARAGVDLDRSTLADWVGQTAQLMRPLVDAVGTYVMTAERLHADDTTVPVLDPGRGRTQTGRLWCYVRDDQPFGGQAPRAVLYCYSPDRKGEHPRQHLAPFRGILQADGYAGYAGLYDRGVTEAACWAHARRKFFDVHAETQSPLAAEALRRIAALYQIEASIRGQPPDERLAVRQARAAPLFGELRSWLENSLGRISGKSSLAGAIRYTLSRWQALTLVLRDGRTCLDNNAAERSMRPICLGRKNWLFAGSNAGGERAAAAYSLIETAKLNGFDPEDYLRQALSRIADHPVKRIDELLPWNMSVRSRKDQRDPVFETLPNSASQILLTG